MNLDKFLGKQIHDEQQAQRAELFAEKDSLTKQRANELRPLSRALDKASKECDKARAEFGMATAHERTATANVNHVKASYKHRISRLENQLIKTAPPEIDEFCAELEDEVTMLCSSGFSRGESSDYKRVNARLIAIRKAIAEAQALKIKPVTDILNELEAIRDALPAVISQ